MMRVRWLPTLLAIGTAATGIAAEVADATIDPVVSLRDTGYFLGDLLEERIDLPLPPGLVLDTAALPAPGRVAPWLEVRSATVLAGRASGAVTVVVTYQIFAEVEQATRVPVPPFKLRVEAGAGARQIAVPEKSFLLSPALPASLGDEDRELKASPAPKPLPTRAAVVGLAASVSVALAAVAFLLWAHDRLPFLPRAPGPFARLWRRWRRGGAQVRRAGARVAQRPGMAVSDPRKPAMAGSGRHALDVAERQRLLREWHAALNASAGETLYASTLPRLFERAPFLLPMRPRIETLFHDSWQSFYGDAPLGEDAVVELFVVLREAALRERGVPC